MLAVTALLEFVYLDASGSTGAVQLSIPSTHTVSDIDAAALAVASMIASITDCVLLRQRIKYSVRADTIPMAAFGSSLKHRGVFLFNVDPPAPDALIEIPGINSDVFLTDGCQANYVIDRSNADVAAFIDTIISNGVTNPFGDAVTACAIGMLQSRV